MLRATLQEAVPLQVLAGDGRTNLHPQVCLYKPNGSLVAALSLPHLGAGLYGTTWTPQEHGYFTAVYVVYEDPGHLVTSYYAQQAETIEVSSDKTNILKVLGLVYDNSVLDQQLYDQQGNLVQARIRCYDSKTTAETANAHGLLFAYRLSAIYSDGRLVRYSITED